MTETQPGQDPLHNPKVNFERSDMYLGQVALFGVAVIILILLTMLIVFGMMRGFKSYQTTSAPTPLLQLRPTPPNPRLQPNPIDGLSAEDQLKILREKEEEILTSYGWVDPQAGLVRIPIERAIELLAGEAAPAAEPAK
ncbi:MAG: hypothetical protein AB1801_17935 [Chloroflexota bacterium]